MFSGLSEIPTNHFFLTKSNDKANNNEESNKLEHEFKVGIVSIEVVGEYSVLVLIVTSALFFLSIGQMVFLSSEE